MSKYNLITGQENLLKLIDSCVIDAIPENVGVCSIDVRLSNELMLESDMGYRSNVWLSLYQSVNLHEYTMTEEGYCLTPGSFCKGKLKEYIKLPSNMMAEFTLRSQIAQNGLSHSLSFLIRPEWEGNLVLEIANNLKYHNWILEEDLRIGQLRFFNI
jgi:deoxycytidine triphosphate deaminase